MPHFIYSESPTPPLIYSTTILTSTFSALSIRWTYSHENKVAVLSDGTNGIRPHLSEEALAETSDLLCRRTVILKSNTDNSSCNGVLARMAAGDWDIPATSGQPTGLLLAPPAAFTCWADLIPRFG